MISFLMNRRVSGAKVKWKWSVIVMPGPDHNIRPDIAGFLLRVRWRGDIVRPQPCIHSQLLRLLRSSPGGSGAVTRGLGSEREYKTRRLMVSREIHEVQTNRRKFSEPVWFQKSFIVCHARAAWCCILVPHPQNTTISCDLLAKPPLLKSTRLECQSLWNVIQTNSVCPSFNIFQLICIKCQFWPLLVWRDRRTSGNVSLLNIQHI